MVPSRRRIGSHASGLFPPGCRRYTPGHPARPTSASHPTASMATPTFAFVAAPTAEAQAALAELKSRYGEADPVHAEILVVLGGDGTMLETLHRHMGRSVNIFGMNCGTVGFLMNRYSADGLPERLAR